MTPDTQPLAAPFALPHPLTPPDLLAKYFKVFADATRVRILELLEDRGELSVGELVERLGLSQPKVSNHLACLRWCGFVISRREHPSVYYRVADQRVLGMLALGRALLADNAEHVAACERVTARGC
ncbi:MAG TPA: metalloregulator ArsR/SmtB family transcription factor [Solirubrobacteraceae bacterium]|nr:metalloregulator ArsR/SmtB family transcription factor [Solirubrobacteraceae bacterium]